MSAQAWPFLIGRTLTEDYRIVVLPGFMDQALSALLRTQAAGDPLPPDAAYLRELRHDPQEPVAVVYRVLLPRRADYGLPGDGLLTDRYGRPIQMTEGIALRGPGPAVAAAGIAGADLDRAHGAVAPAYREFWAQGPRFRRAASQPFTLAGPGTAETEVTLEEQVPAPPSPTSPAVPATTGPRTARQRLRRRARAAAWVAGGLGSAALATVAAIAAVPGASPPGRAAPSPAAALRAVCDALLAGRPGDAYALTIAAYRRGTSRAKFAARLLPGGSPAAGCISWLQPVAGQDPARGMLVIGRPYAPATFWSVRLVGRPGRWQVADLTQMPARYAS